MPRLSPAVMIAGVLCIPAGACAADPPGTMNATTSPERVSLFDANLHMRSADVRIGMKGHGLSVFKGTQIERFEVEVLAVLRNSEQIATDVVLIKASGANLEHTGPIAGMSGSPIYLRCDDGKDRLIGAFAFGWSGAKEPIAGVQPIEQMLALESRPSKPDPARHAAAQSRDLRYDLLATGAIPKLRKVEATSLADLISLSRRRVGSPVGRLMPLSVPLGMSGFQSSAAQALAEALRPAGFGPMLPLDAPGLADTRPSDNDTVAPGSALVVPILTGDLNLVAVGTCTTVIGDRVFGFGHSMFGEGRSTLPFAAGAVDAVIPTTEISFKLGRAGKTIGTLATDAVAGVAGSIGPVPGTVPVTMNVRRPDGDRTYRFRLARHPRATTGALAAAAMSASEFRGSPEARGATRWDMVLRFDGDRALHLHDITANGNPFGNDGFVAALAMPLEAVMGNPFAEIELQSVEANVELLPDEAVEIATLVEMNLARTRFKAGETVSIDLHLQLDRGERVVRRVELTLPDDLEPGQYPLSVTESAAAIDATAASRPFEFEVTSIDDLIATINATQAFSSDAVYLRLERPEQARVAVGRQALPDLPKSRASLLAESGRSDVTTFISAVTKRVELPYVLMAGEAQATITVTRD